MEDKKTGGKRVDLPLARCRDGRGRGRRHWLRITGWPGWQRAAKGLPAWGVVPDRKPGQRTVLNKHMKIAIPVDNERLHSHFGGSSRFAIVEVDPGARTILQFDTLPAPAHQPGAFPRWLESLGVQVVIAGGIGHRALSLFAERGIQVVAGPPNEPVKEAVQAYLNGALTAQPEGCHHHHEHGHAHGPHGHEHGHGHHGGPCH